MSSGSKNYIMRYNARMVIEYHLGDRVKLRKAHPCGGYEWTVVRLGADIGLECDTCHHRVLLTRRELAHRTKQYFPIPIPEEPNSG